MTRELIALAFRRTCAGLLCFAAASAVAAPKAPYWSVEFGRHATREAALAQIRQLPSVPNLRAEQRPRGWYVRAGAWETKSQADAIAKTLAAQGHTSRVLQIENPVKWTQPAAAVEPVPVAPIPARTPPPVKPAARTSPSPAVARIRGVDETQSVAQADSDLTTLDLEQLLSMQVTGVTGRGVSYLNSPAAVFVLTGEDIRRSGVRNIAEALRMVPGLQVARTSAQDYTVTSRGFGADKLQVLVDGRSVYSPLTSTVFWDVLDPYLEDIERIEVIRGPGATVWGANAVNGVINIVTRTAADSAGAHVHAGGGNEERAFGGFRSGGRLGEFGEGRAYAQAHERDSTDRADGAERADGISQFTAGARVDSAVGRGKLSISGDVYKARLYSAAFPANTVADGEAAGRNAGLRWTQPWAGDSETIVSLYYDGYDRELPTVYSESRDTYDVSVQHNLGASGRHRLTGGAGTRISHDETGGPPLLIVFQPPDRTMTTTNLFIQDEVDFGDVSLIVGSKFENNTFTDFEYQPSVRLAWSITPEVFTWAAASRATRTPNRIDHDIGIKCTGPAAPVPECAGTEVISIGSPIASERLVAYEWGLRAQLATDLVTDVALFANDYADLRTTETGLMFANNGDALALGGELTASWRPRDWASLTAFYNYVHIDARTRAGSTDTTTVATLEKGTPQHAAGLRAGAQFSACSVDGYVRYVDGVPGPKVPSYTELNLRLGWQVTPRLELSVVGENLLDASHPEAGANAVTRAEVPRSIFALMAWRLW